MDELLNYVSQFVSHIQDTGQNYSPDMQRQLAAFLEEVYQFINEQNRPREPQIEAGLPVGAGLLWNLSGGDPEIFTNYLQTVPDAELNALLTNPTRLQQIISRLQENQPQQRNREIDGIPQAPIQSSNIWGFTYDPKNKDLFVRFQGDGIYKYNNVPPMIFEMFRRGSVPARTEGQNQYGEWWVGKRPSLGASLFELIRNGGYPYQRLQ